LFPAWRHHAVFTGSPLTLVQAEADHRRHAIIEQVIADLKNGPLAHLPSRRFNANGAWLVLASMAFNLTRARRARVALSTPGANTATIRRQLIKVPARPVRSARRVQLRLPANWPRADDWLDLFTAALSPPAAIAASTRPHSHQRISPGKAGQTGGSTTPATHSAGTHDQQRSFESDRCASGLNPASVRGRRS
jgi:hypothetical protein